MTWRVALFVNLMLLMCLNLKAQAIAPLDIDEGATQVALVVELNTGDVVYEYDKHRRITPASLTKLMTTAAILTKEYDTETFETSIYWDKSKSVLTIVGGGDPTLDSRYLSYSKTDDLISKIEKLIGEEKYIKTLVINENYLVGAKYNSKRLWEDMGNYYGAAWSPINIADNTFTITMSSPNELGQRCSVVSIDSEISDSIDCYVYSYSGKADSAYVYGTNTEQMYISGAIPNGRSYFKIKGALNSPNICFANRIKEKLALKGIEIKTVQYNKKTKGQIEGEKTELFSPSILEIAQQTNQRSINLYADALLMKLGEERGETTWDRALYRLNAFVENTAGEKSLLYDGSGLSPMNKLTASQIVSVLVKMYRSDKYKAFKSTLSVAGKNGTLASLCKGTSLEGRIMGKSGTMTGVKGYAGYITNDKNKELVFCIVVNNYTETTKELVNKIERWLVELVKK